MPDSLQNKYIVTLLKIISQVSHFLFLDQESKTLFEEHIQRYNNLKSIEGILSLERELKILRDYFEKINGVSFAFLFGSRSKGYGRDTSDFDIGIYFTPENPLNIEFEENKKYPLADKIWRDLELILKKEVDLIVLNNASCSLSAEIVAKGIPIVIKDRRIFMDFLLTVTSLAEDWRNFVKDYYEIFQRSKSLSEHDKENLQKIILLTI